MLNTGLGKDSVPQAQRVKTCQSQVDGLNGLTGRLRMGLSLDVVVSEAGILRHQDTDLASAVLVVVVVQVMVKEEWRLFRSVS